MEKTRLLIESELSKKYKSKIEDEKRLFQNTQGVWFNVVKMGNEEPWDFFVIEYMDTYEDGDSYYPSDYENIDEMLKEMIDEIER